MVAAAVDQLEITTVVEGELVRVSLRGDLDLSSAPRLISSLRDSIALSPRQVEVDCAQIDFLDSAGIRSFIVSRNEALRAGIALALVNPSRQVQRVLDMTGLGTLLSPS